MHLRGRYLSLILIGGSVGIAVRYLLTEVLPGWRGILVGTFLINITGAFALGSLLEFFVRRGPDEGIHPSLRLPVGTGLLGGFTTFSS